jgi:hypothetical protein
MALTAHRMELAPDVLDTRLSHIRIKNRLVGTITARHHQHPHYPLAKYSVRLLDRGTIDFVSSPGMQQSDEPDIGQQVTLEIPTGDVLLSPPRWVSFLEDNCWPARVVLAANGGFKSLLVLKLLGRCLTFTTTDNMFWLNRPPRAWDRVTIHIPLNAISIKQRYPGHSRLRPRLLTDITRATQEKAQRDL